MKALLVWYPSKDNSGRCTSRCWIPLGNVRATVLPSKMDVMHPEGLGFVRTEYPQPFEAELVNLDVKVGRGGNFFLIAYPSDNRRFPLPGITEPLFLEHTTARNPMWTLELAPNRYVRIFQGRLDRVHFNNPHVDDCLSWNHPSVADPPDESDIPCWVEYVMAKNNRVVGQAYPSDTAVRATPLPFSLTVCICEKIAADWRHEQIKRLVIEEWGFIYRVSRSITESMLHMLSPSCDCVSTVVASDTASRLMEDRLYRYVVTDRSHATLDIQVVESIRRFRERPPIEEIKRIVRQLAT